MVYGTMGGDGLPQTQAAVFTRHMRHGQDLGAAIAAPRVELSVESRFEPALIGKLETAGHRVRVVGALDPLMGHAGAVVRHANGLLEGAADPRGDGCAAAY